MSETVKDGRYLVRNKANGEESEIEVKTGPSWQSVYRDGQDWPIQTLGKFLRAHEIVRPVNGS